jgi:hypothetical protein
MTLWSAVNECKWSYGQNSICIPSVDVSYYTYTVYVMLPIGLLIYASPIPIKVETLDSMFRFPEKPTMVVGIRDA